MAYYPLCTKEEIQKFVTKYDPPPVVKVKVKKVLTEEQEEELEGIMGIVDKDGDGTIELKELSNYASNVGIDEDVIEEWFTQYDKDGSGTLDAEEFKEFFREVWTSD